MSPSFKFIRNYDLYLGIRRRDHWLIILLLLNLVCNNTVLGASREGYSAWYYTPVLDYCTKYLVPAVQKDT